jgi:hypothetical protein
MTTTHDTQPFAAPTTEQIATYQRDGFLIVDEFLTADEVELARSRWDDVFQHRWTTGIAPDEINYDPATTPPDRTRQLCNVWKADPVVASVVLSAKVGQ